MIYFVCRMKIIETVGADPGFSFRRGANDFVRSRASQAQSPNSLTGFTARVQSPPKDPGSSRALSCSLVLSEPYSDAF